MSECYNSKYQFTIFYFHISTEQGAFVKHMQYMEIAIDLDVIERLFNALSAGQGCEYAVFQGRVL